MKLYVIEMKEGKDWKPVNICNTDGRMIKSELSSARFQFPRFKFRVKPYTRDK